MKVYSTYMPTSMSPVNHGVERTTTDSPLVAKVIRIGGDIFLVHEALPIRNPVLLGVAAEGTAQETWFPFKYTYSSCLQLSNTFKNKAGVCHSLPLVLDSSFSLEETAFERTTDKIPESV